MPTILAVAAESPEARPGVVASLMERLAQAGVNVEGYALLQCNQIFSVSDVEVARAAIKDAGLAVNEYEAAVVELEDRPGALGEVFRRIADAGLNVEFSYVGPKGQLLVAADDADRLRTLL